MLLSADFAPVANVPSALMLSLMIASMISGVTAPKTKKVKTPQVSALTSTSSIDVVQSTSEAASTSTSSIDVVQSTSEAASTSTSSMDVVESTSEAAPTSISSIDVVQSTARTSSVTCTSDCCRVTYIWQEMGKYTTVAATSATACCYYLGSTTQTSGIPGVYCTSDGTVTKLDWYGKGLTGLIPSTIGNLVNLNYL
jgi:hypothetical protein